MESDVAQLLICLTVFLASVGGLALWLIWCHSNR